MSTVDELANEIATLAAHLDAATQRLLACIRAFDDAGGWARQGAVSCAHWLSWRVGLDLATAREKVRVARALGRLPLTDAAFSRGELSYAKVRAITRVATSDNEQRLLELSRYSTGAQLERICRSYRQVVRSLTDEGALPEERTFRERILPGGMVKIELVLHPDEAALVRQAFERAQDHLRAEQEGTSTPPPPGVTKHTLPRKSRAPRITFNSTGPSSPQAREQGNRQSLPKGGLRSSRRPLPSPRPSSRRTPTTPPAPGETDFRYSSIWTKTSWPPMAAGWAPWTTERASRPKPFSAWPATPDSYPPRRTARAPSSTSAAAPAPSPRQSAAPSGFAIAAAATPAATEPASCTATTSSTGCPAAPPAWTTSSSSATPTTRWSTRDTARSKPPKETQPPSSFAPPTENGSRPSQRRRP